MKLAITFQDEPDGVMLIPSDEIKAVKDKIDAHQPVTPAELFAFTIYFDIVTNLEGLAQAQAGKAAATEVQDECGGDCASCLHCPGNETRH